MKLLKIILASSVLTLALAGAASAAYFYDPVVNDSANDSGAGGGSADIRTAQHYYGTGTTTGQFFTIALRSASNSANSYNILIDNKAGSGSTFNGISGIDYYLITNYNGTSSTLYKWNGTNFVTSTDFTTIVTQPANKKGLTWEVHHDLGSNYIWYPTTTNTALTTVYDSTPAVTATPIPAAAWLLGSGIVGLIGIKRRNQKRSTCGIHDLA